MDSWPARAEATADDSPTVPLVDAEVTVAPLRDWTPRAFEALRRGDWLAWAHECLSPADVRTWLLVDPDGAEVGDFFDAWEDLTGQDVETVLSVTGFVDAHADAVEADLQRYYRTDLRDVWRPSGGLSGLTWRRLRVLIDALPGESATKTETRDELSDAELADMSKAAKGHGPWSRAEYLLAQVVDLLGWEIYAQYHSQGGTPKAPEPLRRPGVVGKNVRPLNDAARAYLQRLRDNHGGAA